MKGTKSGPHKYFPLYGMYNAACQYPLKKNHVKLIVTKFEFEVTRTLLVP